MKLNFRIRTLLVFVLFVCVLLAVVTHLHRRGARQTAVSSELQELGALVLKDNQSVEVDTYTVPAPDGGSMNIGLPIVSESTEQYRQARRFFGESLFVKHTTVLLCSPPECDIDGLAAKISELPHLRSIRFFAGALSPTDCKRLQVLCPGIELTAINETYPSPEWVAHATPNQ